MMMRIRWLLFALGICCGGPGCSLFVQAARDLTYEAKLCMQDALEAHRNHSLAEEALARCGGTKQGSPNYAHGFKSGFADYLRNGGAGLPPPLPPRHYWGVKYQSVEGHQAIDEWYAGYHDGTAAAKESGYRNFVVVPTQSAILPAPVVPPPFLGPPNLQPPIPLEEAPSPSPLPPTTERPASLPHSEAERATIMAPVRPISVPPAGVPQLPPLLAPAATRFRSPAGEARPALPATLGTIVEQTLPAVNLPSIVVGTPDVDPAPAIVRPADEAFRHRNQQPSAGDPAVGP
jgi:hypothetical protein